MLTPSSRARRISFGRHGRAAAPHHRYDVLLISSGVSSGFWKTTKVQSEAEIKAEIQAEHAQIARASTVAVVGGGASFLPY